MTPLEESKYLGGCMDAIDALEAHANRGREVSDGSGGDELKRFGEHATRTCTECDTPVAEMTERQKIWHRIYRDYVLVGCEGYLLFDPNEFGVSMPGWDDWTDHANCIPEEDR